MTAASTLVNATLEYGVTDSVTFVLLVSVAVSLLLSYLWAIRQAVGLPLPRLRLPIQSQWQASHLLLGATRPAGAHTWKPGLVPLMVMQAFL